MTNNFPKKCIVILKGERQITKIDDESLPLYFRDLTSRHYQLLTREEEIELSKRVQSGDRKAVDKLVNTMSTLIPILAEILSAYSAIKCGFSEM